MVFLMKDVAGQVEELSGQLREAVQVCLEENGPLAYEPMFTSGRSKIEAIRRTAATGSFEALYNSLQSISFGRLVSIWSEDIDGDRKALVSVCKDRVRKAVVKCRELYGQQSPEEVVESIKGTRAVMRELLRPTGMSDQAYRDAKRGRNVLGFNDLEHLTLEVLYEREETGDGEETVSRRPPQVADELSRQCEEILVDEYQDSNYVQEALITGTSREQSSHLSVLMVRDVKQNIYRFYLVRLELSMDKYETYSGEGGPRQMIELQQNFRSRESVLTSVNDTFYQIMTKNLGGVAYTPKTVLCSGARFKEVSRRTVSDPGADVGRSGSRGAAPVSLKAGAPTELLLVDTDADTLRQLDEDSLGYTAKELEARLIAGGIHQLVNEDQGILVQDKSREGYRRARYDDMVILFRSMSRWSEVPVNVLMNEGIPAFVQTRTGYFDTVEMETIPSLLSTADNPIQDIPLAAVTRSPIVGMNDEETAWVMAVYKRNSRKGQDRGVYGAWKLWLEEGWIAVDLSGISVKTAHFISFKSRRLSILMERLRGKARRLPIRELLYRAYREGGYYNYVSAMSARETRRVNLDMLVEKAAVHKSTNYKGLFHFVRYIEKLKKSDTDSGEVSAVGEQDSTMRIIGIHKSKGLGFPVVFLAGLGKRSNKQDAYGQILLDADLGAAADFLDPEPRVRAPTPKKRAPKRRTELGTMGEELKVLYVAMTRAREKLIMTVTDESLENKLGKWKDIPLSQGQLPYTILASANSCLNRLLMAQPAIPASHMEMHQIQIEDLISEGIAQQITREVKKEDPLNLDGRKVYDVTFGVRLREVLEYEYPYESDIRLYAMMSVSESEKQSQMGRTGDAIGTDGGNLEEVVLGELKTLTGSRDVAGSGPGESGEQKKTVSAGPSRATLHGTAYHAVLEHIHFRKMHDLAEVKPVVGKLPEGGFLGQGAHDFIDPKVIQGFLSNPLGRCTTKARPEGCTYKEQRLIIGIPAREMGLGGSDELVPMQGIIDTYLEEGGELALTDYRTDHIPEGDPRQGAEMLAERYGVQSDCHERVLTQLTGKHVRERIIYPFTFQMNINV